MDRERSTVELNDQIDRVSFHSRNARLFKYLIDISAFVNFFFGNNKINKTFVLIVSYFYIHYVCDFFHNFLSH